MQHDRNLNEYVEQEQGCNNAVRFPACTRDCAFKKCCKKYKHGKRCKKCPKQKDDK